MNAKPSIGFQTEVDFELPKGYVDESGMLHRRGVMRLATAADEILPLRDPRVSSGVHWDGIACAGLGYKSPLLCPW